MDYLGKVSCDHRVGSPVVSYTLLTCPRCLGTGEYGGIEIFSTVTTVSGYNQVEQAIKKILSEKVRDTGYGFDYSLLRSVIDTNTVPSIKKEIVRCIEYLRSSQQKEKARGVGYSPRELIYSIRSLEVNQSSTEPRSIIATLVVTTEAGNSIQVTQTLKR